jgi:hypothetical protein
VIGRAKVFCLAGVVLLALASFVLFLIFRGPRYNGHSLSYWGDRYVSIPNSPKGPTLSDEEYARREAFQHEFKEAIRSIGPQAAPYFLDELRWRAPDWKRWLWQIKFPRKPFIDMEVYQHHEIALFGFRALGTNGLWILPQLLNDQRHCSEASRILGYMGDGAFPVITNALANPNLMVQAEALKNLYDFRKLHGAEIKTLLPPFGHSPYPYVQAEAMKLFCSCGVSAEVAMPMLIEGLPSPDERVQLAALSAVICYADEAVAAIPALEKLSNARSKTVLTIAEGAIRAIKRSAAARK